MNLIPGGPLQAVLNVVDANGVRVAANTGPTLTLRKNGTIVAGFALTTTTIVAGHYVITGTADAGWAHGDQITLDADTGTTGAGQVEAWTVVIPATAAAITTLQATATGIAAKTVNLPAAPAAVGSAMTLDASAITAIEGALLNEADGQALLAAISAKIQTLFDSGADVPVSTLVSLIAAAILSNPANKLLTDGTGQVAASNLPSVPTVDQIATRLLITPANKLLTDGTGQVTATNGGGSGSGGTVTDFSAEALAQLDGIKFIGPLTLQEGSPRQLVAGDDYSGARVIVLESEGLPDLSTASSITFSVRRLDRDRTLAITATTVAYSSSPKKLSVTLTSAQTRVTPGWYEFDIEAVVASKKQTVVGPGVRIEILADQTQ